MSESAMTQTVILGRVKIYTRRGDRGETDLFAVPKDDLRVEAYGAVDELNSAIGLAAAASSQPDVQALCQGIQGTLFDLGAYLASPDAERRAKSKIPEPQQRDVDALEGHIDAFEGELEPLRTFVLPGGTAAAAGFHLARTVCRRAERRCVSLDRADALDPLALRYVNRLSDLLFVLARLENRRSGLEDVPWTGRSD
jgi:cob(I)alamin adenosyltransferase